MTPSLLRRPVVIGLGLLFLIVVPVVLIQRDTISSLILRGGDLTMTGEDAGASEHAQLAMEFLAALRATDTLAIARPATNEQVARVRREAAQPTDDYQKMRTMMLGDLPAEPGALRGQIKSVQIHEGRAVVTLETRANSWFVLLAAENGVWKVSGF